jgi:hypothetical protein
MNRSGSLARRLGVALLCLSLALPALPAWAVVVELVNGQRIEGVLRQASSARVLVESGGQVLAFEAAEVRAIHFNEARPAPAPAPPAASPRAEDRAPEPGPPATSPRADEPAPDPAQVLAAVKALHSAVDRGTSRRAYSPRVRRARAVVDRYLASSPDAPPPGGVALGEAMRFYQLAEFAWNNRGVASSIVWLQKDDALARCPGYRDFVEDMQAKGEPHYSDRTRSFVQISDGVLDVLWSCAAERIAEAEAAIPKPAVSSRPEADRRAAGASPRAGADTRAAGSAAPSRPGAEETDAPRPPALTTADRQ